MAPDAIVGAPAEVRANGSGKKGIKGIVLIAIGLVLLLGIAAVTFGVTSNDPTIEKATKAIPVLSPTDKDGWSKTTDPNLPCKMSVDFPGDRTQETVEGVVTWRSFVGKDEVLQVQCRELTEKKPDDEVLKVFLDARVKADIEAKGGEVLLTKEGGTGGVGGIYFEARYPMEKNEALVAKGADPDTASWVFGYYLLRGDKTQYLTTVTIDGVSKKPTAQDKFLSSYQALP